MSVRAHVMGPWRSVKMKMGSLLVDVSRVTDGKQRKMHALNLVCLHFFQKNPDIYPCGSFLVACVSP